MSVHLSFFMFPDNNQTELAKEVSAFMTARGWHDMEAKFSATMFIFAGGEICQKEFRETFEDQPVLDFWYTDIERSGPGRIVQLQTPTGTTMRDLIPIVKAHRKQNEL
jgi:hypothetical protein